MRPALTFSSADILTEYKTLAQTPGKVARNDGDATKAIAGAAKRFEATFEFPYLAHAAMEPLNCVVKLGRDQCEVWNGEQFQTGDQHAVAQTVGLKPEQVKLNMLYAGGSFGRRANPAADYVVEAASIAKALSISGKFDVPVKLVWTREDDMKGGYYRPAYLHTLKAGLDGDGNVVGWQHRIVGQSILTGTPFETMMVKDGVDATSVEGASTLPYAIAEPRGRPAFADGRRAGALVALGRLDRTPRTRPRRSSTSSRSRPARIRSRSAAHCSRSIRGISPRSSSRRRNPAGARRSRRARPARSAAAASPSTNRSTPRSRRSPR